MYVLACYHDAGRRNVVRSEQKRVGCKRDLFATNSTRKGPNTVSKTQTPPSAPKPAPNIQVSDGSYDCFAGRAVGAIVDAQIKTGVLRFNTGQYQRPATFGAGRPKVVDKLKIKRVYHGTDQSAPLRLK